MWYQLGKIALGIWLLIAPAVLPSTMPGADLARIIGPMVIWLAALAIRDVTRPVHLLGLPAGIVLIVGPWLLPHAGTLAVATSLSGVGVFVLSVPRGRIRHRTDGGWLALVEPATLPPRAGT